MDNPIRGLHKQFESRVRLGVMSVLVVNNWVDFNSLKDMLEITDGNLASHIKALEAEQLIEVRKEFIKRKPRTSYRVTPLGRRKFREHLDALETLLNQKP